MHGDESHSTTTSIGTRAIVPGPQGPRIPHQNLVVGVVTGGTMKVASGQISPIVGAFEANVKQIAEVYERACRDQARFLLTPELGLCGYPPLDLLDRSDILEKSDKALLELSKMTRSKGCSLVVGHIFQNPTGFGRRIQNSVSVLHNGVSVFQQSKSLLPTYDIFDEARYFEPASKIDLWNCDGYPIALAICEDLWGKASFSGRRVYLIDPVEVYREKGCQLVCSLASSPFEWGKRVIRNRLHSDVAKRLGVPLVYVNQVGATDEVLFDGGSFILDSQGKKRQQLPYFRSGYACADLVFESSVIRDVGSESTSEDSIDETEILARGLILGIREYFKRTGFSKAVVGLSGGIDSAVVGTLAAAALGPENVLGVAMPSQFSSAHSLEDAEKLASNLGIQFEVRPIKFLYSMAAREIAGNRELLPIALENLQARLRGIVLMTLSNHYSMLVLTTGNKSELAMGYCTLYGDMAGALAPIGDVFKTQVYELARHLNATLGNVIPERSLTKPPSAELRPDQKDQDSLPPYEVLDPLLKSYIEDHLGVDELETKFGNFSKQSEYQLNEQWIRQTIRTLEINEYKRRQSAPVLRVSSKAFGIGRRLPLAKGFS